MQRSQKAAAVLCTLLLVCATANALWGWNRKAQGQDESDAVNAPDQQFYWYNSKTGDSQWEMPQYEFTDGER